MSESSTKPLLSDQGDTNLSKERFSFNQSLSEKERLMIEKDEGVFLHQSLSTPVMGSLEKTFGSYIHTHSTQKLLDLHGNGVHNAGFSNPYIIKKVKEQLDSNLAFTPRRYTNDVSIELAEKLVEISPVGLTRVLFCPGGSQAVELAVMLAKQVTRKWKTISFYNSYHGNGFQAASIGGQSLFSANCGPMVPGSIHIEYPNYYRNPWGWTDTRQIDNEYLRQFEIAVYHNPEVAAIIAEPVSANPTVPSVYFWQRVKEICQANNMLLIFDEIITGFGRTGKMFGCEHFVTPDVLVLGKSLGGGLLPYAGILTHEKYNTLHEKSIGHFTHEKNPLCAAAGLAEVNFILENNLVDNAEKLGKYLKEQLLALKERHNLIGHVEGIGMHLGVELVLNHNTKEKAVRQAEEFMYKCLKKGISLKIIDKNIVALRPALVLTKAEADFIIETFNEVLSIIEGDN